MLAPRVEFAHLPQSTATGIGTVNDIRASRKQPTKNLKGYVRIPAVLAVRVNALLGWLESRCWRDDGTAPRECYGEKMRLVDEASKETRDNRRLKPGLCEVGPTASHDAGGLRIPSSVLGRFRRRTHCRVNTTSVSKDIHSGCGRGSATELSEVSFGPQYVPYSLATITDEPSIPTS